MAEADFTPYGVIYLVTNKANGKVYVGQTTRGIVERWQGHCRGDSYCFALSGAIKKYGKESFSIEVIDSASSKEELDRKEVLHISAYGSASRDKGYNLRGGGSFGKHTEESKDRMSVSVRKAYENPEFRRKLSEVRTGVKRSQEFCAKTSLRMQGSVLSSSAKEKISGAVKESWKSEEYREKVKRGQQRARSEDSYKKMVSENTRSQWSDPEKRERLIAGLSASRRAMWSDPEKKAAIVAKRNATNAARRAAMSSKE